MMTCTSETVQILTHYDSCQTGDNRQNMCIHMKTCTGGVVLIMNQYMTPANWFRNGFLFAGLALAERYIQMKKNSVFSQVRNTDVMEGCLSQPVPEDQLEDLVVQAKDYALSHGGWSSLSQSTH